MPTKQELDAATQSILNDSDTLHQIVHGAEDGNDINTENGPVKPLAKVIAAIEAEGINTPVQEALNLKLGVKDENNIGRYAGMTAAGPPTQGSYLAGDWVQTQEGETWHCRASGTPGIWSISGASRWGNQSLVAPPSDYSGTRIYPGMVSGTMNLHPNRVYAVTYPLDPVMGLVGIHVKVYTPPTEPGATIKVGIYDDYRGAPGNLIASSNSVSVATTGDKQLLLDNIVAGGQWVWIAIVAQNCPSNGPVMGKMIYAPYTPQRLLNVWDQGYENLFVTMENNIPSALKTRWSRETTSTMLNNTAPIFAMKFGPPPTAPIIQADRYPVVLPSLPTDEGSVCEPSVGYFANRDANERYVMFFTSGWNTQMTTWATAPSIDGPWTRKGTFNAIGRGALYVDPSDNHIYFYSAGVKQWCHHGNTVEEMVASTKVAVMSLPQAAMPNCTSFFQNTTTYRRGPNDYVMLFENQDNVDHPTLWQSGLATATSPLGPFTATHWPLTSLRQTIADGAGFGLVGHTSAGHLHKDGATYKLWYHAADYGNLPSEIFHATSTDLVNWTVDPRRRIARKHPLEVDQAADPFFFRDPVTGIGYLFWSAMENSVPYAAVMRTNPNVLTIDE